MVDPMRLIHGIAHAAEPDQLTHFPEAAEARTDPSVSWGPCRGLFGDGLIKESDMGGICALA